MENIPDKELPPSKLLFGLSCVFCLLIGGLVGYLFGQNSLTTFGIRQRIPAVSLSPSPIENLPIPPTPMVTTRRLIKPDSPGKYTDREHGYTIEYPTDWELYRDDLVRVGSNLQLFHPKCAGESLVLPEQKQFCTMISLPTRIGGIGWGYGSERQTVEKILLKNNVTAEKSTFYYNDHSLISWVFNANTPQEEQEAENSDLVAFAQINENYIPGSLETVNAIVQSITFIK